MKKRICIDFDGVLNNYTGWPGSENPSTPKNGVENFLCNLSKSYEIYIFTTRDCETVNRWLIKYDLKQYISNITNIKEPAFVYIDDRAIKFDGDYSKTITEIKNFKPHWAT
jgi:hypothetical protein